MRKIVGLLVLAAGAVALAVSQFMSGDERAHTTDVAAGAIAVVADAASRMAADDRPYTLVVATRVGRGRLGERDQQVAVRAEISLRGGAVLSDMCASLPRVRDAINTLVADRIGPRLREGHPFPADELAGDGRLLMASLNRLVPGEAVTGVRLGLKPAGDARDEGCNNRMRAGQGGAPRAPRPDR